MKVLRNIIIGATVFAKVVIAAFRPDGLYVLENGYQPLMEIYIFLDIIMCAAVFLGGSHEEKQSIKKSKQSH